MKSFFSILLALALLNGNITLAADTHKKEGTSLQQKKKAKKSTKSKREYITGPRGGCYYINSNGNKTYVDRSLCN